MYCKNCGSQIDDNAYVCVHCGVRTDATLSNQGKSKFCPHCGSEIDYNAYVCVHCGKKVVSDEPKRKSSATIYAVIGFICSLLTVTFAGAVLAIYGIVSANKIGDDKGLKLSIASLVYSVVISVLTIVLSLLF